MMQLHGPGALHMPAARALQGVRPHKLRSASTGGNGAPYQYKEDTWMIYLTYDRTDNPMDYASASIYDFSTAQPEFNPSAGTFLSRKVKGERSYLDVGGSYLNSTGDYIGFWNCWYLGGDSPFTTEPLIDAKVTASSITLSTGATLSCSASKYDDFGAVEHLPCSGQLLPSKAQCVSSTGPPTDGFSGKCQGSNYNSKGVYSYVYDGCAVDEAFAAAMIETDCGRRYTLVLSRLGFSMQRSSSKTVGKPSSRPSAGGHSF
jgi:hypothetical protein